MIIYYDELLSGEWRFVRLNFDTGEYALDELGYNESVAYIQKYLALGYTFIHR